MKERKIASIMSFLASFCFFMAYLFGARETKLNLVLGGVWLCIGTMNLYVLFKKK